MLSLYSLLIAVLTVYGDIQCGNDTLVSEPLVVYQQEHHDVFINVVNPFGFHDSSLPVWTVNCSQLNVTAEEVKRSMTIHYGGLKLYMDRQFNNTMLQYSISTISGKETYTSDWISLRIGNAPTLSNDKAVKTAFDSGGTISGTCSGITGNPQPTISLSKISDNNSMSTGVIILPRYHFLDDCLWMETTAQDVGHCEILAENCFGRTCVRISPTAANNHPFVVVNVPSKCNRSLTVDISQDLAVPYRVSGSQELVLTWFHEGQQLINGSHISYNWSHLLIANAVVQDTGLYTVIVNDSVLSSSDHFSLIVQGKPMSADTCDKLWGVALAAALVSGVMTGLVTCIFMRKRKKLRMVPSSVTENSENSLYSGYCDMTMGSGQRGLVRPYSTVLLPVGTDKNGNGVFM
jgi:hypothetical protein